MMEKNELPVDCFVNKQLLIQGENLVVLQALKKIPVISEGVRLVYIDPPFGTNQRFSMTDSRAATISRLNDACAGARPGLSTGDSS